MRLSILIPAYNEAATIQQVVKRVLAVDLPCESEVVVVDDGSSDETAQRLASISDPRLRIGAHEENRGKGAAIQTASTMATGDYMVICDADGEYSPEEIPKLIEPIIVGDADVVFGARTFGSHSSYSYWYVMGNKAITTVANVLFNSYISDLETGFKVIPLKLYRSLNVRAQGFAMEAEVTGKLLARGTRPYEVPISYRARSREEGKKITWKDGVQAIGVLGAVRARETWRSSQGRRR